MPSDSASPLQVTFTPDVPARTHIVVVEHVPQTAVREDGPRGGRAPTEAEDAAFRLAAEIADVIADDLRFRAHCSRTDRYPEGIEHTVLEPFDETRWQRLEFQTRCVPGELARDHASSY